MRITRRGQVTIPAHIRRDMGLLPRTEVEFILSGDKVILRKAGCGLRRGQQLVATMRGRADKAMSTDEIMALTRGS